MKGSSKDAIEYKIADALERLATVFRSASWREAERAGLNPMQRQVLLKLFNSSDSTWTLSRLALELCVSKASLSDTIAALERKSLVIRTRDNFDGRVLSISLADRGTQLADSMSIAPLEIVEQIASLSDERKEQLFEGLLECIFQMQRGGLIPYTKMCMSCKHFERRDARPYCNLMQTPLLTNELRLDCPEHLLNVDS